MCPSEWGWGEAAAIGDRHPLCRVLTLGQLHDSRFLLAYFPRASLNPLVRGTATRQVVYRPGRERKVLAREEGDEAGYLIRPAWAPHRDLGQHEV